MPLCGHGESLSIALADDDHTPPPAGDESLIGEKVTANMPRNYSRCGPHWARFRLWIANCRRRRSASPSSADKACENTVPASDKRTCCSGVVRVPNMDTAVLKIDSNSASISPSTTEKKSPRHESLPPSGRHASHLETQSREKPNALAQRINSHLFQRLW